MILSNFKHIYTFQIFLVTGGEKHFLDFLDTTEIYDTNLRKWAISGAKLPRPMKGLRATNIDGRVLIFGN